MKKIIQSLLLFFTCFFAFEKQEIAAKRFNFSALLFNTASGMLFSSAFALISVNVSITVFAFFVFVPIILYKWSTPIGYRNNLAMAGVLKEVWLDVLLTNFWRSSDFITRSVDLSSEVNNNVINLAEYGAAPNVLIDNNTYPITTVEFDPQALTLPLKKFETENTRVRGFKQKQYSFSAVNAIVQEHRNSLREKQTDVTAHAWAPSADGTNKIVIPTTGASDGGATPFKRFTIEILIGMQNAFDTKKWSKEGRVCVLHPNHVADLAVQDISLFKAFMNIQNGVPLNLYGWDIYVYSGTATYNKSTGAKKSFGAAAAPTTDTVSSLFYCQGEVMHATGTLDMFYKEKDINTENRAEELGFEQFYTALSMRDKCIGAVYSAAAA